MVMIQEIPAPMDWRVTDLAGNNAVERVNEQFDKLIGMIDDTASEADDAIARIGADIPDFGSIEFASTFNPYTIQTIVELWDGSVVPDPIDLVMPEAQTIEAPEKPGDAPDTGFTPEAFTGELAFDDNLTPPSDQFIYSEPEYSSPLSDKIVSEVMEILTAGGQTLGDTIETAQWERAKDRIADHYDEEYQKVTSAFAVDGWDIPQGSQNAAVTELLNKRNRAYEQVNYEIMIEQARLALANYHKAMETGVAMENIFRDFFNAVYNRALAAATQTVVQGIALYNTLVAYNQLKLVKYKTEAETFSITQEIAIRAELAKLEIYKAKVSVFAAEWSGEETKMRAYAAAVGAEGTKAQAISSVNKDKISSAALQLEAHTSHQKNLIGLEGAKAQNASANASHEETTAQLSIAAQSSNIRNAIERIKMMEQQYKVISQLFTQRYASLISAFNISASMGDSEQTSESLSHSYNHNDSVSATVMQSDE